MLHCCYFSKEEERWVRVLWLNSICEVGRDLPTDPSPGPLAAIYENPTSGNNPIAFSGIARRVLCKKIMHIRIRYDVCTNLCKLTDQQIIVPQSQCGNGHGQIIQYQNP